MLSSEEAVEIFISHKSEDIAIASIVKVSYFLLGPEDST